MSNQHVSLDELDRWLAEQHRDLVSDLATTLDVEAGLGEVLVRSRYEDFAADLGRSLDVEAGLAAVVRAAPPEEPPITNPREGITDVAAPRLRTPSVTSGLRHLAHGRALLAAAAVVIGLVVTIPTVIWNSSEIWKTPATTAPVVGLAGLDIQNYGVTPPSGNGTVSCGPGETVTRFVFTVSASGSGTVHYVAQPDKDLSNLPVRTGIITFTGPTRTEKIDLPAPYNTNEVQQLGMRVTITSPEDFRGESSADYFCRPPTPAPQ